MVYEFAKAFMVFMITHSFHVLSKWTFNPLYGVWVHPNLEYGVPVWSLNLVADINHSERIQMLSTRLITGICNPPYVERLQRLGLHSLQRRWLWADLVSEFKISTGLLDVDLKFFFCLPLHVVLRGHPYKVLQVKSHLQRKLVAFSVGVLKYWNKLPAVVVKVPSVNSFKKR